MEYLKTEVLVVGGGTGGTAAAIQAARRGAQTILMSEFPWLGGMLTAAGVTAPDGNELAAFQTGIWGAFLHELYRRQPGGLDHAWVSFFTYDPQIGSAIFADWVQELPNLHWISGQVPLEVIRQGDRITGIRTADYQIDATIILDGTELGDVLALGDVPYRWGWEWQSEWQEPSAPLQPSLLTQRYPVQSPTWVVVLQDFGEGAIAPEIPPSPFDNDDCFTGAWDGYSPEQFLNYGRLPGDRFMINWPQRGNDYGVDLNRLIQSAEARSAVLQEARWYSQAFARFIQTHLGRRYGLADHTFPYFAAPGGGAYALHPYYRESRRLIGVNTVREQDILPLPGGQVAPLPLDTSGKVTAIALGNYPNDHHYPDESLPLQPKSIRWGGRWTGTPFALPYGCLIPAEVEGLLVCEKNIAVSHIANGATRLQPIVLGIGQAAGMAAALCIEQGCLPRELTVNSLQTALLTEPTAPTAVVPLMNVPFYHPEWLHWQRHYLDRPDLYPQDGNCPSAENTVIKQAKQFLRDASSNQTFFGLFKRYGEQNYSLSILTPSVISDRDVMLVTLHPDINQRLQHYSSGQLLHVLGRMNGTGGWLLVEDVIENSVEN